MISIIVSSYKKDLFSNFTANVKQTIGDINYEIIQIENPGLMGICAAYNKGGKRAIFPFLIFSHEDILFHTVNWGKLLIKIFENDKDIGLLGIAGGGYKPLFYSGWGIAPSSFMIGSHYGESNLTKTKNGVTKNSKLNQSKRIPIEFIEPEIVNEEVVLLDGLFLATKIDVFNEIMFDEVIFKDFHCYDLDYSLQVNKKYKVVVNYNILIEHLSAGNFDNKWIDNIKIFTKKWLFELPVFSKKYSDNEKNIFEYLAFEQYLRICKNQKIKVIHSITPLFNYYYIKKIGVINWIKLNNMIIKKFSFLAIGLMKKNHLKR